ncbi:MAG: translocation/assembly module TamB domain-containing protein [Fibrobacteria bacterium]|nr:translocation/assembly module TamB domain-containing protein [Fibrobacteria bacterium]
MSLIRKKTFFFVILPAATLPCLILCISLLLNASFVHEIVLRNINTRLPGSITFQSLKLSLFNGQVDCTEARLLNIDGSPLAGFEHLTLQVNLLSLIRNKYVVNKFHLSTPWAKLEVDSTGQLNLIHALIDSKEKDQKQKSTTPFQMPFFDLKSFLVTNANFNYRDKTNETQYTLPDIRLKAGLILPRRDANLEIKLDSGFLSIGTAEIPLTKAIFNAAMKRGSIDSLSIELQSQKSSINIIGQIKDLFTVPLFDLSLKADAHLPELTGAINSKEIVTGDAGLFIEIKGPLNNPQIIADLDYTGGNVKTVNIGPSAGTIRLRNKKVTIDSIMLSLFEGKVFVSGDVNMNEVFPNGLMGKEKYLNRCSYQLVTTTKGLNLKHLGSQQKPVQGRGQGIFRLTGTGLDPDSLKATITTNLKLTDFGYGKKIRSLLNGTINLSTDIASGVIHCRKLEMAYGTTQLHLTGKYKLSTAFYEGTLKTIIPSVGNTLSSFGVEGIEGNVLNSIVVSGNLNQQNILSALSLKSEIEAKALKYQNYAFGNISGIATLNKGNSSLVLALQNGNSALSLNADGGIPFITVGKGGQNSKVFTSSIKADSLFLGDFLLDSLFQANLGQSRGSEQDSGLTQEASSWESLQRPLSFFADIHIETNSSRLWIDSILIHEREMFLRGIGVFDIATKKLDANLSFSTGEISPYIKSIVNQDAAGVFSGQGSITGFIQQPVLAMQMSGVGLRYNNFHLDSVALEAETDSAGRANIKQLLLNAGNSTVHARGSLGPLFQSSPILLTSLNGEIELMSDGFNLHDCNDSLQGRLSLLSHIVHAPDSGFNGKLVITGEAIDVSGYTLESFETQTIFQKDSIIFQKVIGQTRENETFSGTGFVTLNKNYQIQLNVPKFPLQHMGNVMPEFINGLLTAEISGQGNLNNPLFKASFRVSEASIGNMALADVEHFSLTYKNRTLYIDTLALQTLENGFLTVSGQVTSAGDPDLKIKGDLSLKLLPLWVPVMSDLSGRLLLDGIIEGSGKEPLVNAEVSIKNASWTVPGLQQNFHDVNAKIKVKPDSIVVEGLNGLWETGAIDFRGAIAHNNWDFGDVQAYLTTNAAPLQVPGMMYMLLNSDLHFAGNIGVDGGGTVNGNILVVEGLYHKDVKINVWESIKKKRPDVSHNNEEHPAFWKNIKWNVAVKSAAPFMVKNNLAQLAVRPNLSYSGTTMSPVINGKAAIESGYILFRKKKFDVTRGNIFFTNPYKIAPELDIKSETHIREYKIFLSLSGELHALTFSLSSEPGLEHEDILSLILTGKTISQLTGKEDFGNTTSATQLLAQVLASSYSGKIEKATGFDEIVLDGGEGQQTGLRLTVGKKLSKRLKTKYLLESEKGEVVQKAVAEYKLSENLILNGFQDSEGKFGGEIKVYLEIE